MFDYRISICSNFAGVKDILRLSRRSLNGYASEYKKVILLMYKQCVFDPVPSEGMCRLPYPCAFCKGGDFRPFSPWPFARRGIQAPHPYEKAQRVKDALTISQSHSENRKVMGVRMRLRLCPTAETSYDSAPMSQASRQRAALSHLTRILGIEPVIKEAKSEAWCGFR